ncbi:MAG: hypothetical protein M3O22_06685 [Pseudomonadota bacterium]|nr:hypothetical protein [Pseudomonadota bacterium]
MQSYSHMVHEQISRALVRSALEGMKDKPGRAAFCAGNFPWNPNLWVPELLAQDVTRQEAAEIQSLLQERLNNTMRNWNYTGAALCVVTARIQVPSLVLEISEEQVRGIVWGLIRPDHSYQGPAEISRKHRTLEDFWLAIRPDKILAPAFCRTFAEQISSQNNSGNYGLLVLRFEKYPELAACFSSDKKADVARYFREVIFGNAQAEGDMESLIRKGLHLPVAQKLTPADCFRLGALPFALLDMDPKARNRILSGVQTDQWLKNGFLEHQTEREPWEDPSGHDPLFAVTCPHIPSWREALVQHFMADPGVDTGRRTASLIPEVWTEINERTARDTAVSVRLLQDISRRHAWDVLVSLGTSWLHQVTAAHGQKIDHAVTVIQACRDFMENCRTSLSGMGTSRLQGVARQLFLNPVLEGTPEALFKHLAGSGLSSVPGPV